MRAILAAFLLAAATPSLLAQPITTAITYQGELSAAGVPANGPYDIRFRLYDAALGGSQIGVTLCSDNVTVTNGKFTALLDFGTQYPGQRRFLEMDVRADTGLACSNSAGFVTLGPRQELTIAPYAAYAMSAGSAANATQFNGQSASFYQDLGNITAGTLGAARLGGSYTNVLTLNNAGNQFTGQFSGNGASLAALNASSVATGTLQDARLTSNVALLNAPQTFSAAKTFSSAPLFSAAGAPFTVSSNTVVPNLNADLLDGLSSSAFLQSVPNPLLLSGSATTIISGDNSAPGTCGVRGLSTAVTGVGAGVYGQSDSTAGLGMRGFASAVSGATAGGYFESVSTTGYGVFGYASASSGINHGGAFYTNSTDGSGAYGYAAAASGTTYGLAGKSESTSGRGVYGVAAAATGTTYGGYFSASSPAGYGVYAENVGVGIAGRSTAADGIVGESEISGRSGVYGYTDTSGAYGGYFTSWVNTGASNGVVGLSHSDAGIGTMGIADSATGTTYGGRFSASSPAGYGIYADNVGTGIYGHSTSSDGVSGQTSFADKAGVYGTTVTPGAYGGKFSSTVTTGASIGLITSSDSDSGVAALCVATSATGTTTGVFGEVSSPTGVAVRGSSGAASGANYGGYFGTNSTAGTGVYGGAFGTTGINYGGYFTTSSIGGYGAFASATSLTGLTFAVAGSNASSSGTGVRGLATSATGVTYGVYGSSSSTSGRGVYGVATATTGTIYGVYGSASTAAAGYAVYANGDMGASGLKPFRIDHPDDPENKYLLHYAAESPDVINFYTGKVQLDAQGEAVVELPRYFAKINRDPRYTLTAIGAAMPLLHVAEEIDEDSLKQGEDAQPGAEALCTFRIAGGAPSGKVSWEVKAVRNDRWARLRGAPVEVQKQDLEKGTYQHPELYGQPPEKGMNYRTPQADGQ
jgi:hypothetical protein